MDLPRNSCGLRVTPFSVVAVVLFSFYTQTPYLLVVVVESGPITSDLQKRYSQLGLLLLWDLIGRRREGARMVLARFYCGHLKVAAGWRDAEGNGFGDAPRPCFWPAAVRWAATSQTHYCWRHYQHRIGGHRYNRKHDLAFAVCTVWAYAGAGERHS